MDDPLDELVSAYRDVADRPTAEPAASRARLIRAVHRQHRNRQLGIVGAIVLAILGSNATTWAWSTGRVDALAEAMGWSSVEPAAPSAPPPSPAPSIAEAAPAPVAAPLVVASGPVRASRMIAPTPVSNAPATNAPATNAPATNAPATNAPATNVLATNAPVTSAPAAVPDDALAQALDEIEPPEAIDEAERRAFEQAHDAHFAGGSMAAALAAWTTYLDRYPTGRFVPEARFNRAIALLRLGRHDEARVAFAAIADGRYGPSRRQDAQRLVEAIDQGRVRAP
ncbi:MAG: hypothetical protein H6719_17490 [Sandaracinaceae bacterium]|nr:hypothetical protein [Sandaracinaceae bacterium]